jgi:hypothetical protein
LTSDKRYNTYHIVKKKDMNYFSKENPNKNSFKIFIALTFVILSSCAAFGQTVDNNAVVNTTAEISVKQENASNNSNMNFVLWFMGTKQDPNATISTNGINTKKQIMTSGMAPNRLLIKAFFKKAVNFESALV